MALLQVIAGLIILVFAGDGLVRGAVTLANKLGIPTLVISLTIIAFGTSAPELVVGVDAVLAGVPELALGNVAGSNIANVMLVVGVPALIYPVACTAPRLGRNFLTMMCATLIMALLALDGVLSRIDGLLLLLGLIAFLGMSAYRAHKQRQESKEASAELDEIAEVQGSLPMATLLVLGGLVGLVVGADLLVDGSVIIARSLGVPEIIIGLSLVAVGTSLPELVTVVAAAVRRESDVALGSVIGSNIFNLLGILGISAMVGDIPVPDKFISIDLIVMIGASLLLLPFIYYKRYISRVSGAVFLSLYTAYMGFLLSLGMIG